jgi:ATP-dependent DNA helicase RecG
VDLELRGPGDVEGTRQSGGIEFKLVNLAADLPILNVAQTLVTKILERDPGLGHPENKLLLDYLKTEESQSPGWSKIS